MASPKYRASSCLEHGATHTLAVDTTLLYLRSLFMMESVCMALLMQSTGKMASQ